MSHMSIIKPSGCGDNEDVLGGYHHFIGDLDSENIAIDEDSGYVLATDADAENNGDDTTCEEIDWGFCSPVEPVALAYQKRDHEGLDPRSHHS